MNLPADRRECAVSGHFILTTYTNQRLFLSFPFPGTVCGLLRSGVAAIFGPLSGITSMHVQSICDALEIPHIETRWDMQLHRDDLSINLYPRPSVLAKAYIDIVRAWNWRHFAVVYEDNDGKSPDTQIPIFPRLSHSLTYSLSHAYSLMLSAAANYSMFVNKICIVNIFFPSL